MYLKGLRGNIHSFGLIVEGCPERDSQFFILGGEYYGKPKRCIVSKREKVPEMV